MKIYSLKVALIWFSFALVFVLYKEDIYSVFPNYYFSQYPILFIFKQLDWIVISAVLLYYHTLGYISKIKDLYETNNILFSHNPIPMWKYTSDTLNITEVNYAACLKYGFTKEEFLKMSIVDLRPQSEQARLLNLLKRQDEDFKAENGLWEHRKKNGESFFVAVSSFIYPDNKAKDSVIVMALDIEDKMDAERKVENLLKEVLGREAYLKSLIDSQSSFLVRIKLNATYSYFNPQFAKAFALPKEAINTLSLDGIIDIESQAIFRDTLNKARNNPQEIQQVNLVMVSNNYKYYTQWEFIGILDDKSNSVKEIQLTGFDITKMILAERNLITANKTLKERNEALSEIAYLQSHKVKGPLARIFGILSLFEGNSLSQEQFLSLLKQCINELNVKVNDVVDKANEFENNPDQNLR